MSRSMAVEELTTLLVNSGYERSSLKFQERCPPYRPVWVYWRPADGSVYAIAVDVGDRIPLDLFNRIKRRLLEEGGAVM